MQIRWRSGGDLAVVAVVTVDVPTQPGPKQGATLLLLFVTWELFVACCLLFVCLLFVACWLLLGVCCLLLAGCEL